MHKIMTLAVVLALAGCSREPAPAPADDANLAAEAPADANLVAAETNMAVPAAMSLNETTWTYTDKDGKKIEESIDAAGQYISTSGADHVDHGTYVAKDGKACFTSAMNKDGEMCWTVADTEVGKSFETTSDKGEKLTVTRVAYVAKQMPAAN
jgi:hypothetical protein